jgi:hypothetical protein
MLARELGEQHDCNGRSKPVCPRITGVDCDPPVVAERHRRFD